MRFVTGAVFTLKRIGSTEKLPDKVLTTTAAGGAAGTRSVSLAYDRYKPFQPTIGQPACSDRRSARRTKFPQR